MTRIPPRPAPIAESLLAMLVLATAPLHAQTVSGRLFESGTTTPIQGATVYLLDEDSNQIDVAETDEAGRFTLEAPNAGAFYLQAEMTGYRTKTDGVLELGEGGEISIAFYLMPQPVELTDSLLAIGERIDPIAAARRRFLEEQGFFERMAEGFGEFITPEEIDARAPTTARNLFWNTRGVRLEEFFVSEAYTLPNGRRVMGEVVMLSRARTPTVYIDGTQVWPPAQAVVGACKSAATAPLGDKHKPWPFPIEDFIDPAVIQAVEIYDGLSELPPGYASIGVCGVILIWTG